MVSAEVKTKAQDMINDNAVMVFSKSYCPFCRATKDLLDKKGATYKSIELDTTAGGSELQDALEQLTNQRSVPNIFIDKKHIGGNSDLQALKNLDDLLKQAGAV